MKFGMNLLLWSSHVTEQHFPVLEKLKRAGYDGVEIPIFEGDEAHYGKLGAEFKRQGLACTGITVCNADASPVSKDAGERQRAVDRLKYVLDMTAAMGGDLACGPYYAPLGTFTGEGATEDEKNRAAEVLRKACDHAKALNIRFAIEFLNRFETYFLNTAADAQAFVKRVNHPNFGMMYDTFHANIEEKHPPQALASLGRELIHVHISENDRGTPGSGHVQWKETFAALKKNGYDGWLTIEAFSRLLPELAAATRVWRDFFPRQEDVYENGLKFMKQMLAGA